MQTQKQEELSKMYALRAGLSVISQKCDIIEENEEKFKKKQLSVCQLENIATRLDGKNYDLMEKARDNGITDFWSKEFFDLYLYNGKDYSNLYGIGKKQPPKKPKLNLTMLNLITALTAVVLLISIILVISSSIAWMSLMFISSIALIFLLILIISKVNNYKKLNKEYEKESNEYAQQQNNYKQAKEYINSEYTRESAAFAKVNEAYKETQFIINEECQNIANTLNENYGSLIDRRDWENLDLIIYNYETGRADTVKEALQLVDKERRNNALIEAIGIATNEICRNIQSLGNTIISGFQSLSAQLEAQRIQIMSELQNCNANISAMITQQSLNNSLLAKANVSSREMVNQMKAVNLKIKQN